MAIWGSSATDIFIPSHNGSLVQGGYEDRTILHYNGSSWSGQNGNVLGTFNDIWGISGSIVFAVGDGGVIAKTTNNGTDWTDGTSGTLHDLHGVWGNSSSNFYAVGESGTILHFNGSGWSTVTSGTVNRLNAVWGNSANNIFVVGEDGTILHFDGSSWNVQESGVKANILGVWGTNDGAHVYAVGNSRWIIDHWEYTLLHWESSAATWNIMTSFSTTTRKLIDIWGTSSSNVYAVGEDGVLLHYNGSAWSEIASGTTADLYGIWGSSASNVYAVGAFGTLLRYDGNSWVPTTPLDSNSEEIYDAAFWNAVTSLKSRVEESSQGSMYRVIYASSQRHGVFSSIDQGKQWHNVTSTPYDINELELGSIIVGSEGGVLQAGDGTMIARVIDDVTLNGIENAYVTYSADIGGQTQTGSNYTDSGGFCVFSVKAGEYAMAASKTGYLTEETLPGDEVPVNAGMTQFVTFVMNDPVIHVFLDGVERFAAGGTISSENGTLTPVVYENFQWSDQETSSGNMMVGYGSWVTLEVGPGPGFGVQSVHVGSTAVSLDGSNRFTLSLLDQPETTVSVVFAPKDGDDDGFEGPLGNNSDCDDSDPAIHPEAQEICDNIDNDCDTLVDENLTQATTCGVGACAGNNGVETCSEGVWGNDTCDPLAGASAEICDNIDNDCDPSTGDGTGESWYGESCDGPDTDLCLEGTLACTAGEQSCTDATGDTDEICDGGDNNCDGLIDENFSDADNDGIADCIDGSDTDEDGFPDNVEIQCGSDPDDINSRCSYGLPWMILLTD
jgi:hypothetical protein